MINQGSVRLGRAERDNNHKLVDIGDRGPNQHRCTRQNFVNTPLAVFDAYTYRIAHHWHKALLTEPAPRLTFNNLIFGFYIVKAADSLYNYASQTKTPHS